MESTTVRILTYSVEEVRGRIPDWGRDRVIRRLAGVDGIALSHDPLIEQVRLGNEPGGFAAIFTVWSPAGAMVDVLVPQEDFAGRPVFVKIIEEAYE